MAVKPILFNTQMVEAIIDGKKTQTRRLVKEIPLCDPYFQVCDGKAYAADENGEWHTAECFCHIHPGDILYVRETYCVGRIEYGEEPDGRNVPYIGQCTGDDRFIPKEWALRNDIGIEDVIWKPSIHMPKHAARIFLRVKNVRAERLQDCGNGWCLDIENEGVKTTQDPILYTNDEKYHDALRAEMKKLWNSTIKPADILKYGWDANPWVWVIEFEKCEMHEGWCV